MIDPSSLCYPESQSLRVTGQWMLDLWELEGEDPKHQVCCSAEEMDYSCPLHMWNTSLHCRSMATSFSLFINLSYDVFLPCLCCKYLILVVDLFMEFCLQQCLPGETKLIWFGQSRHLEWDGNAGPANLWAEDVDSRCLLLLGEPLSLFKDQHWTLWDTGIVV